MVTDKDDNIDYKKAFFYVVKSLSYVERDMCDKCPAFGRSCCGVCTKLKFKAKEYKKMLQEKRFKKDE